MADDLERVSHLSEHLRHMRRQGRSQRTVECRVWVLTRFADWLAFDPIDASFDDLELWQDTLLVRSESWMRWCTSIIRPYYKFVHARGYRADDPTALLVVPPNPVRLPRPMSETDVMHAIAHAPPRVFPWLLLAGWPGLRAAEIAGLRGENFTVDDDGRVWVDVIGKGDRERRVPIPLWMWPLLSPYIPDAGPCFVYVAQPWRQVTPRLVSQYTANYLHAQGITLTLHSLRHRCATRTLDAAGGNLRVVQDLLGHAKLTTTQLYTAVEPEAIADALDDIPAPRMAGAEVRRLRRSREAER